MPKEIRKWACTECKAEYDEKEEAHACETSHNAPIKFAPYYPLGSKSRLAQTIEVTLKSGEVAYYDLRD